MMGRKRVLMSKLLVLSMCTSIVPTTITFAGEKDNIKETVTNVVQTTGAAVSVVEKNTTEEVANNKLVNSSANDELDFKFDANTGTITGYSGSDTELVIPSTINGVSVKSIDNYAFSNNNNIQKVEISNGVTSIGNWAFSCINLKSITIPDSVTSIGYSAFYGCSALISINIPDSVTSIGQVALARCSSLTNISVDDNNTIYKSIDGALYSKDGTEIVQCPAGKTSITIPDGVTTIGYCAFNGCESLTSVTIPDSVTHIEKGGLDRESEITFYYVQSEKIKQLLINNGANESKIILVNS